MINPTQSGPNLMGTLPAKFGQTTRAATPGSFGSILSKAASVSIPDTSESNGVNISAAAKVLASSGISYASIEASYDAVNQQRKKDGCPEDALARFEGARSAFLTIAKRAVDTGGLENPQKFIANLNSDELETLRVANTLAFTIVPSGLTEEGAFNLLVTPKQARDFQNDGITQIGAGNCIIFPPNDAPQSFKDTWEAMTKDMDWTTRTVLEQTMWDAGPGRPVDGVPISDRIGQARAAIDYDKLINDSIETTRFTLDHGGIMPAGVLEALLEMKDHFGAFVGRPGSIPDANYHSPLSATP